MEFRCDGSVFANGVFSFERCDGSVIAARLRLGEDGVIAGHAHPNESSWRLKGGNLEFLDDAGKPTTVFDRVELHDDHKVFFGRQDGFYLHALKQDMSFDPGLSFRRARELIAVAATRGRRRLAVFLVHHAAAWDSISGIYEAMARSDDFAPLVVTIPHRFGRVAYSGEDEVSHMLTALGVPHVRFDFACHRDGLALLKSLAPDVLLRQSPWDADIPEDYSLDDLDFTRLVFTDYGIGICDGWNDYDTPFHNKAWLLCCANEDQRRQYVEHTKHKGARAHVTGYPKFDALLERGRAKSVWPIAGERRRYRIIWSPHHSVAPNDLAFGTFPWVCSDILDWVTRDREIEMVFKPHPMLMETHGGVGKARFDAFMAAWNALDNTAVRTGGDYAPLMSASDAMLTDGVSFLAEYPLFDKPLVWLDSGRHKKLNAMGARAVEANYKVRTVGEAIAIFERHRDRGEDPMKARRQRVIDYLTPFPGEAAARVLQCIRDRLLDETGR